MELAGRLGQRCGDGGVGGVARCVRGHLRVRARAPGDLVSGPAPYGSRRAIVARLVDLPGRSRDTLRVQFGDVTGSYGRTRTIARRSAIRNPRLVVNARGEAALAWFEDRGTSNDRVYVSVRSAGGSFDRPHRLVQERIRNVSVAVGPAGDIVVAWDAHGRIRTRYRARSDRAFRRADTLRSRDTFNATLQSRVAESGHAWVGWTAQLLTEGGDRGDAFVQAAVRSPGGRRFHTAAVLAQAPGSAFPTPVSLSVAADGSATLAWTLWERDTMAIQAARVSTSGTPVVQDVTRFGAVEPVDTATAATARDGTAVVVWTQLVDAFSNRSRLHASVQPPGGRWGPPEPVSPGMQAMAPVAAYPPEGGPPLVLFANRPTGELDGTVAQVATRAE